MIGFLLTGSALAVLGVSCIFVDRIADQARNMSADGETNWPEHDPSWRP